MVQNGLLFYNIDALVQRLQNNVVPYLGGAQTRRDSLVPYNCEAFSQSGSGGGAANDPMILQNISLSLPRSVFLSFLPRIWPECHCFFPLSSTSTSNIMGGNRLSFLRTNVSLSLFETRKEGQQQQQREFLLFLFAESERGVRFARPFAASSALFQYVIRHRRRDKIRPCAPPRITRNKNPRHER